MMRGHSRMSLNKECHQNSIVLLRGKPYKKRVILADANIPYKLSMDRNTNNLFFCINADEFSDQSFHSVILNLGTGSASVITGIRNGFVSAVDNGNSTVYLGGSQGIYKFNYSTNDVETQPIVAETDIFDMYFHNNLYYVDTSRQDLHVFRDGKTSVISEVKGRLIHHFVFDINSNLLYVHSSELYVLPKGAKHPIRIGGISEDLNIRGFAADVNEQPYLIASDGIYSFHSRNEMEKVLPVENSYGLAFDKENNIIYSDERTITKLTPVLPMET